MLTVLVLVTFGFQVTLTTQKNTSIAFEAFDVVKEILLKSNEKDVLIFIYDSKVKNGRIWREIDFHKYFLLDVETMSEDEATFCLRSIAIQNGGAYLQFIVLTSNDFIISTLQLVNRIDDDSNKTINIRHWSKWIIFEKNIDIGLLLATVQVFDNLFLIHVDTQRFCTTAATLVMSRNGSKFSYVNISNGYNHERAFPNMVYGYNGRHMRVVTKTWRPFLEEKHENGSTKFVGYLADMMESIANTLNFTYSFYDDIESDWSGVINGSETGFFYKVGNGDYDILCAPSAVTHERFNILDYVLPMHFTDFVRPTYRLKPVDSLKMIFTKPFQFEVWSVILATSMGFCILLWLQEKYHPYYHSECNMKLKNLVFDVCRILLNQGGVVEVETISGKIFLACFWIFCVIIAAVYKGNLVAFFTDKQSPELFKDLKDVYNSDYKIGAIASGVYPASLKKSKDPFLQSFSAKLERFAEEDPEMKSLNNTIHLSRVLAGDYVYMSDYASVSFIYVNNCDIVLMDSVFDQQYGLATAKGSPLKYDLEKVMRALSSGGILDVLAKKWWPKRRKGLCDTHIIAKEIEMNDVTVLFIFISCCLALCFLVLILETLCSKKEKVI